MTVSKILPICPTPRKRHIKEAAREMASAYPVVFRDLLKGKM